MVESNNYDEYVKLKHENEKLKKDLKELSTSNIIVIETLDHDGDAMVMIECLDLKRRKRKTKGLRQRYK